MVFIAKDVAASHERTGCGMIDCKKALTESSDDMNAAVDILRGKGLAAANKKSDRIAAGGVAYAQVNALGSIVVVVEMNVETDFTARNAEFQAFVKTVADMVEERNPTGVDALLNLTASSFDKKVDDPLKKKIQTIGENIEIRRFACMEGSVISYVHADGRIGVIAQFGTSAETAAKPEFREYTKNITMQIAAVSPSYLNEQAIPTDMAEHEKKILTKQVINDGKLAAITEKIIVGRLSRFFKDICLVDQVYVKDSDKNVQQYTDPVTKELGGEVTIEAFARFERGEGLEKKEDDFTNKIASMVEQSVSYWYGKE